MTGDAFGRLLAGVCAVVAAAGIAGCGGESKDDDQPSLSESTASTRSSSAGPLPSESAQTTPLGGGELIVFERTVTGAEEPDLYVVGADGGEARLLTSPGSGPHWSPDGSELAFSACLNPPDCSTAAALLDRSTGDVRALYTRDPELFTVCVLWAPAGKDLACEGFGDADETRTGIYTIRASDGQGLTRITKNPGGDDIPLAYSPDGTLLLFDRTDPSRDEPTNHALFVAPTTGGRPHRITPWGYSDDWASWSPDSRTVVFGTNGYLYRVDPERPRLSTITLDMPQSSSHTVAFDVSFSPDGDWIVFSVDGSGLYTARPDGSDVKQLTDSPTGDHHSTWGTASGS
jgi:Tol biopolymer transport system component